MGEHSTATEWPDREPFACGFFCFPAFERSSKYAACDHPESVHYSIDGEAVGCITCEDETSL